MPVWNLGEPGIHFLLELAEVWHLVVEGTGHRCSTWRQFYMLQQVFSAEQFSSHCGDLVCVRGAKPVVDGRRFVSLD